MFSRLSGSSKPAQSRRVDSREEVSDVRLKKVTAMSLAVASVLQPMTGALSMATAQQTPLTPAPVTAGVAGEIGELELLAADNETLRLATDQFKAGEYEEAAATLSSVKVDDLSASDKKAYDRLSARVTEAVDGRKAARASFEKGEALLAEGKLGDAVKAYRDATGSRYVDQATRVKSLEQIALAETQLRASEVQDKATYAEARELLKQGDLDGAKAKFEALDKKGFKAGLFQRSPADYLAEISKKQGGPVETPKAETPATPAGPSSKELYNKGVELFRAGDLTGAKASFEAAQAAGYKPGLFERSPADYLKRIEQQTAAAATPAAPATPEAPAAATPAPATPAPATPTTPAATNPPAVTVTEGEKPATPAATPEASTPENKENGSQFYEAGVRQFREGNLNEAQKNFQAAKDAGYKAGLFQDSPDRWLKRVEDRRVELANEEKAAAQRVADAAEKTAADSKKTEARTAYAAGRENYNKGDWIEARKYFVQSVELGYKPGLFETSPQKYLERMDKKEQADAAKAAAELASAATPATPATPAVPATPAAVEPATPAVPATPPATPAAPTTPAAPAPSAAELVVQARAAQAAGDNGKALELYTQAATIDPNNQQAVAGRNELAAAAPAGQPGSILTEADRSVRARRSVATYNFDEALGRAREATASNSFEAARQALNEARAARNADPAVFTPAELAGFDNQINVAQSALDAAIAARARVEQEEASRRLTTAERTRIDTAREERERSVRALIEQARRLVEEAKFQEALNVVDQILAIDPGNDYAQGVRPLIEDRALIQQQRRYIEDYRSNSTKLFNRAVENMIPYDDLLRYPQNWPDISELRDAGNAERSGKSTIDQATLALLDKRLPEIRFEGVAFGDVVDALRDMTGANIFVEWRTLEQAGIDRTTPVTITRLTNVRFEKALNTILSEVGGGGTPLAFSIDEGVIRISTRDAISQQVTMVVYDVSDLIFRPLDAGEAPEIEFQLEPVTRGGGGGGGGNLFQGQGGGQQQDQTPEELLTELVTLIQENVARDEWQVNGGNSTIGQFRTGSAYSLIVRGNRVTHTEMEKFLNQLRASSNVQVAVEARFLSVNRSFLEDVGLDLDFTLNRFGSMSPRFGSNTGTNSAFVNNIPIQQNSSTYTSNPRTGLPTLLSGTDSNTTPAMSIQGSFLDDFSVDFLLRATQASVRRTVAQAPRLMLFSGQRSRVLVGEYQFFVTDLSPIVGTGAVAFQPNPSAVFSGVELWVHAVVSADRKYVQLNVVPRLRELTGVQNFVFQTAATGTNGGGGTLPPGSTVPQAGIATATIQLPTQRFTGIFTSASVPDGGTLLLGGLTQAGESENEVGVPVLSKIPFIKRLFTNRSMAKDENVVLVLVKPTIVIQKEVEAKSFPLLSNKVAN